MNKLTAKQIKDYLKNSHKCPVCKSSNIEGREVDIDDGGVFQEVTCLDCGASWTDQYKLVGIELNEDAEEINRRDEKNGLYGEHEDIAN